MFSSTKLQLLLSSKRKKLKNRSGRNRKHRDTAAATTAIKKTEIKFILL